MFLCETTFLKTLSVCNLCFFFFFSHFAELPLLFPVGACFLGFLPLRLAEFYLDILFPPFLWPKLCITSWVPVLVLSADPCQTIGRTTVQITVDFLTTSSWIYLHWARANSFQSNSWWLLVSQYFQVKTYWSQGCFSYLNPIRELIALLSFFLPSAHLFTLPENTITPKLYASGCL